MRKILFISLLALVMCFSFTANSKASSYFLWADTVNDGMRDLLLGSLNTYDGNITGKNNYDYFSFSGHPVNGPNPQAHALKMFLYERTTNGNTFFNIIGGADGQGHNHWHTFDLTVDVTGSANPKKTLGDEGGEFKKTGNHFDGDWRFRKNSDGGVIGNLKESEDWELTINLGDVSEFNKVVFASKGSSNIHIEDYINDNEWNRYFISYTDQPLNNNEADPIPEPTSLLLLSGGLLGAFVNRKRRR